jgi:hypothetical protein
MVEERRSRRWLLAVAWFNVLVGVIGGGTGLFLEALMGLSVHDEDSIPPFRLAVACGLLCVAGVQLLILPRWPRLAAVWAAVSVVVAASGVAASFWRHEALKPSGGGMLMIAGLTAAVGLVALIEIVYLCRAGGGGPGMKRDIAGFA